MASNSLVTFPNIATHCTYYYLGSNTGSFMCRHSDRHLIYTFYGSTKFSTGENNFINLYFKIIAFMSFIFLRHVWRRRILKYLRDEELQRYGCQVLASIPVLLWPSFYRAKRITFERMSKFIKPLWAMQRHFGPLGLGEVLQLLPLIAVLIACCCTTDNEQKITIFVT